MNDVYRCSFVAAALIASSAATLATADTANPSFQDCDACPTMVEIPAGSAVLGYEPYAANVKRGDLPLRDVQIEYRWALAAHETTVAQYRAFVTATGYAPKHEGCNTWDETRIVGYVMSHVWNAPGFNQNEQHPVVCVSHVDATAYVNWLSEQTGKSYRLPSSTEFEYATRAGTRGPWFWGSDNRMACEYANVADHSFRRQFEYAPTFNCDDGFRRTAPVGNYDANPWGLYDMLGNAWEWTDDCLHRDAPENVPVDGSAWLAADGGECDRRTPRGGSWVSGTDWVRASAQAGDRAAYRSQLLGFRVALTLK